MLHALMQCLLVAHQASRVQVVAIVSNLQEKPVRQWHDAGISFIQCPQGIQDPAVLEHLQNVLQPDVLLLASWGEILTPHTLEVLAPIKVWNLHPSLLPAHRGVNPYLACILAGESQSGLTLHQLVAGIDGGKILAQRAVPIDAEMSGLDLQVRTLEAIPLLFEDVITQVNAVGLEAFHQTASEQPLWGASHHRLAQITQVVLNPHSPLDVLQRQAHAVRDWMPCLLPWVGGFHWDVASFHCNRNEKDPTSLEWMHPVSGTRCFVTVKGLYYKGLKCFCARGIVPLFVKVYRFLKAF
jgi:methionyl-tRNA formyltransferase